MTVLSNLKRIQRRFKIAGLSGIFFATLAIAFACSPLQSSLPVAVTETSTSQLPVGLGTNISGIADYSTQLPFIDEFRAARPWIPQCVESDPGCTNGWDTQEFDRLDLDEHNWVKSLPAAADPPIFTRVGTLLFREIQGDYPGGQYVVLYEGEGTIEYQFDAQKDEARSQPGRDVINVTPSDAGIYIVITATDPNQTGNYLRNFHVVPIASESTFKTEIFNPVFLDRLDRFQALRFMDWMKTNDSTQTAWGDRPKVEDATYALKGVPVEIMVTLANRLHADPWFNLPIQATDEYIREFAQVVKDQLDPNLRVYVELSNEVWNWQFSQAHYAQEQGKARWGEQDDGYMQWYGMRSAQMAELWKQIFADQPADRLQTIIGTQTVWRGLEAAALDCPLWVAEGHAPCHASASLYAIAGYFSGNLSQTENQAAVEALLNESDGGFEKAFAQLERGGVLPAHGYSDSLVGVFDLFAYHLNVAKRRNLQLVVYEGGQHLVSANDEKLTNFFLALNRDRRMGELYRQLLQGWKDAGGSLFMNFSDIGAWSRWGSWGVLEHVNQAHSPRYDALMQFLDELS